ncbi:MAG: MFS transporter [Cyclobacteriaceae bacterium]|nr:MFS transporter [Cyclobacteriaceae bacterium]
MVKHKEKLYTYKFWLLSLSSFFFFASFNLIIPELPDYLTSLGGGDHKGLIIPLFTLTAGLSRPFSGRLTDTIGRIPIIIYGVFVCIIAGFLYPVMTTVLGFFALRLVHGMSTGFKPTATSAYVGDIAPESRRGEAMGILGMFGSLGMAAGPAIGSWVAMHFGYSWMFYCSSGFALLSILVVLNMPETLIAKEKFRWSLLKLKRKDILEPKAYPSAIAMLLTAFSFGTVLTLIPDLSTHLGIANKGIFFSIFTISSLLVRIVSGTLSDKFGRVPIIIAGACMYSFTMILIGMAANAGAFYVGAFLFGVASGLTSPTIFAWTIDLADTMRRGRAMATMFIALEVGIGVGGVISGYSYDNNPANFIISFAISSILALSAVVYLVRYQLIRRRQATDRK